MRHRASRSPTPPESIKPSSRIGGIPSLASKGRREERAAAIPEHKHCPVCGKAISTKLQYCSATCEETSEKRRKSEERVRLIFYVFLAVTLLIFFLSSLIRLPV
ncbi:MAG: DUF2116 family Zn-ribbon domain-containing protein [Candidatus Bathyarchaeia archaeon]